MSKIIFEDQHFQQIDGTKTPFALGDYENCTFIQCNFSNNNLTDFRFIECDFKECNFSSATLTETAFREVHFKDCKMLGLRFEACNAFLLEMHFENCQLNFSSFYELILKNTKFKACQLHEVDFTKTNLTGSTFDNCDLTRASFEYSILEKTDFCTARNFTINPENNRIRKAKFSRMALEGLLRKYDLVIE